ncbi:ATG8-interacting protein 1 [Argentina anserina]|uniref:ATG8-interacting protein 1 n=1 Tax=Argentina anserina TaxID=57926 RepID=UPI0021762312|nr:ATG8-interacting protein 1 [Potentilla anserina]
MADNEEGEESTGRGNGWEVVSLTASAYAAAPGPQEVDLRNDDDSGGYGELAETSHALFMSGHFVFPPNQHENLPLELESSEVDEEKVQKEIVDEISIEEGGRSRGKEEENLSLKGLDVSDEFAGIQFLNEKDTRLPIGSKEFGEGTGLEGLNFDDDEQDVYGDSVLRGSSTYGENTDICGITESLEEDLDLSGDISQSPRPKDEKFGGSDLPCGAWWKRRASSLYSHAKEANAYWSIFVAAAVMGLVMLGQRWHNESWQVLQQKWLSSVDQKAGRILGPISRLKDVIVGGQRRGSFVGGASSEL